MLGLIQLGCMQFQNSGLHATLELAIASWIKPTPFLFERTDESLATRVQNRKRCCSPIYRAFISIPLIYLFSFHSFKLGLVALNFASPSHVLGALNEHIF